MEQQKKAAGAAQAGRACGGRQAASRRQSSAPGREGGPLGGRRELCARSRRPGGEGGHAQPGGAPVRPHRRRWCAAGKGQRRGQWQHVLRRSARRNPQPRHVDNFRSLGQVYLAHLWIVQRRTHRQGVPHVAVKHGPSKLAAPPRRSMATAPLTTPLTSSTRPPHLVHFLADDLGWASVGYHRAAGDEGRGRGRASVRN